MPGMAAGCPTMPGVWTYLNVKTLALLVLPMKNENNRSKRKTMDQQTTLVISNRSKLLMGLIAGQGVENQLKIRRSPCIGWNALAFWNHKRSWTFKKLAICLRIGYPGVFDGLEEGKR